MTKLWAILSHAGISLLIFLVILYFIVFHWYPFPLFETDGGWQGIRIIATVDIVLGPLLTFIVYKPGKKGLAFDLTVIGVIQLCALTYGIWMVHQERPVAVVFVEDHFRTLPVYHLEEAGVKSSELIRFGEDLPAMIFLNVPEDADQFYEIQKMALSSRRNIYLLGEYYQPLTDINRSRIRKHGLDMETILKDRPEDMEIYRQYINSNKERADMLLFYPLYSRFSISIVSVDKNSLKLLDNLGISPSGT